jgi:5-methylcytosine-specific restriction endonuclease McrA
MGSKTGAMKIAAQRAGLSMAAYYARLAAGEKWCTRCKAWHPRAAFGQDKSRADGLAAQCTKGKNAAARNAYTPKPRPMAGSRRFVQVRTGDKKQARARINYLVRMRVIAAPGDLPCTDCGHLGPEVRHEYDHHLGYGAENQEHVEPVCSRCHGRREARRNLAG